MTGTMTWEVATKSSAPLWHYFVKTKIAARLENVTCLPSDYGALQLITRGLKKK